MCLVARILKSKDDRKIYKMRIMLKRRSNFLACQIFCKYNRRSPLRKFSELGETAGFAGYLRHRRN